MKTKRLKGGARRSSARLDGSFEEAARGAGRSTSELNRPGKGLRLLSSGIWLRVLGLWSLVFGLLGPGFVSAVQAQPAAPQLVRFTVFSARPIADLAFVPRPNAEPRALVFYPTARSPRYEYRGAMPLRFVDSQSGDVVAEAAIPAAIADALLLFLPPQKPDDSGTLKYRIAVLDDGAARHGPGGLGIINLSGLALTGTVNGTPLVLKPGLNPTIQAGRSARVVLRTEFKGQPYQSYAGTIALGANQRALLILFPPYYQGSLEVQSRLLIDAPGAAVRR